MVQGFRLVIMNAWVVCDLQVGQSELVGKVAEANNALSNRLRRLPTYHETAEVLNVSASTVRLVSERSRAPISLDKLLLNDRGPMALQVLYLTASFLRDKFLYLSGTAVGWGGPHLPV